MERKESEEDDPKRPAPAPAVEELEEDPLSKRPEPIPPTPRVDHPPLLFERERPEMPPPPTLKDPLALLVDCKSESANAVRGDCGSGSMMEINCT
uniref:Uncharacterized protein n=1 Tax=Rhabditophanes sp. KR3021 TaxID=114890 RepID=A0AC35TH07_9BILA